MRACRGLLIAGRCRSQQHLVLCGAADALHELPNGREVAHRGCAERPAMGSYTVPAAAARDIPVSRARVTSTTDLVGTARTTRNLKVGADALLVDLDNAIDHELAGVGGALPSRLSLNVVQRDVEQSLLHLTCH